MESAKISPQNSPNNPKNRSLDQMDYTKLGRGLVVYTPSFDEIDYLTQIARIDLPEIASDPLIGKIVEHNPETFWAVATTNQSGRDPRGFIAVLPLNEEGTLALFDGNLDTSNPKLEYIARQHQRVAALYVWCIYTQDRLAGAISLLMERYQSPKYHAVPMFCRAVTADSKRFFPTLGWTQGAHWRDRFRPDIMEYRRRSSDDLPNECAVALPAQDRFDFSHREPSNDNQSNRQVNFEIKVVRNLDELQSVFAIRAATYMAEQCCPFAEEFDGNDLTGTHLLGYVDGEPAGCLRIRYFGEFAKIERLAVLAKFRTTTLALRLARSGVNFTQQKGYKRLYGHSAERLMKFWERVGFRKRPGRPTLVFSDIEYFEMEAALDTDQPHLSIDNDAHILIRPEGRWHVPGVLEKSSARGISTDLVATAAND